MTMLPVTPPSGTLYEQVPCPPRAWPLSHPDLLASIGVLFGLTPAMPQRCRFLEIGCGSGGNIVPMAEELGESNFLGIDLSSRHCEMSRKLSATLELKNLELRQQDLLHFPEDAGEFDYIIAHGVYSGLSPDRQEKLLYLCRRHLAPQGIAYISYNALPGWLGLGMLRDMMLRQGASATTSADRVNKARGMLDFLVNSAPTDRLVAGGPASGALTGPWAALLKGLAESVRSLTEADLLHDFLSAPNEALYLHDFMARASVHGLGYLGDAHVETMSPASFPADFENAVRSVAANNLDAEQAMDLLRNRMTRHTLLVRADSAAPRPARPQAVADLYAGSAVEPLPDDGGPPRFRHPKGSELSTDDLFVRCTLRSLADAWPDRISFGEILENTWGQMGLGPGPQSQGALGIAMADKVAALLIQGFFTGMVDLSPRPAGWASTLPDRPQARRLARLQAETGDTVTTLRHQNLKLNRAARQLLRLLDGTRDVPQILFDLEKLIRVSAKALGGRAKVDDDDRARLAKGLDHDLKRFVVEGLLVK